VQGKCVDVCPYIQHEHTRGGSVPPEAWLKVGYWLGCLHRLGASLAAEAPIDLPYGNYPSDKLVTQCLNHARRQVPSQYDAELSQAQNMLVKAQAFLEPRRSSLPQGVVHGDLHFWNVLYSGQQAVAIVDLDFLQRGYLIADLAFESEWLIAWERDRGGPWLGIMDRYIAAYEQGRRDPLTDIEKQCLPWARLVNHVFFFFQNIAGACHDEDKWRGDLNSAKNLAQAK
jgi:Ser/Thr protein kinase RdoA (MazF antagonist)